MELSWWSQGYFINIEISKYLCLICWRWGESWPTWSWQTELLSWLSSGSLGVLGLILSRCQNGNQCWLVVGPSPPLLSSLPPLTQIALLSLQVRVVMETFHVSLSFFLFVECWCHDATWVKSRGPLATNIFKILKIYIINTTPVCPSCNSFIFYSWQEMT